MSMLLKCGDVVPGCAAEVRAENEADVLKQAAAHAASAHGVTEVTPELAGKIKSVIRQA